MSARLQDLAKSFARHLRAEGKAPATIRVYGKAVDLFSTWLEAQGRPAIVDEMDRAAVREWLAQLADRCEPGTIRTRYQGLRRFCGWCLDEGELDANPMTGLRVPEAPAKPVAVLTDDQLAALLKACSGKTFNDRRDEALIRVLLDTGVRVSEACGLTLDDVDLDQAMAMVRGKGNKIRPIYFSARTVRAVDRYIRIRGAHRWAHLQALFLTQRGPLSTEGARERVHILGEQAGIPGLYPHMFRHTFAHDFLLAGGGERDLKRLAGWSSDAMLSRYGASQADARARAAAQRMARGDRV